MLRSGKKALLALMLSGTAIASASQFKQGEVLVKYRDGVLRTRSTMDVLYQSIKVKKVKRYSKLMRGLEQLTLDEDTSVEEAIRQLRSDQSVEFAQPNYLLYTLPVQEPSGATASSRGAGLTSCIFPGIPLLPGCNHYLSDEDFSDGAAFVSSKPILKVAPNEVNPPTADPDLKMLWGMAKINAVDAWKEHRGSKNLIVADIDTGIDYNHVDLGFNVWRNPAPSDKNDVTGFDFVHNDGLPFDDQEHGTHTAGTIGAVGGNGVGVSGVSQVVSLMALKFISRDGSGTTADAIRAIDYAIAHGAKVLSNSWGGQGDPDNKALYEAIDRARVKGVLFVAAAGNSSADNDSPDSASYPAAFDNDNLISVAATDREDSLAYFSNFGKKTTHLAAPGDKIYSTVPGDRYKAMSGTSMACPHVAGAAALVWSKHPDWDYKRVKKALLSTVDALPSLSDKVISGGRLNVLKALKYDDLDSTKP